LEWLNKCKEIYRKYPILNPNYKRDENRVNLYNLIYEISENVPNNIVIVPGSSGACSEATLQSIKIKKGMRIFNTPGLGSIGFGISAALGACLASNKKKTICIEGDGGFIMNIQELEVIRRLNLPIIFFVLNNDGYGSIKSTQDSYFKGKYIASTFDSGLSLPSIKKIAKTFNINHFIIKKNKELKSICNKIINSGMSFQPVICEVLVEKNHKTIPRAMSFKNRDGEFETAPMQYMIPRLSEEEEKQNII